MKLPTWRSWCGDFHFEGLTAIILLKDLVQPAIKKKAFLITASP